MKLIFTFLLLIIFSVSMFSQEKAFIREYYYKASETDSKISSRQKALKEVKSLLIEELGTYVESYVNYEVTEENNKITKDFFTNEIKTLSAGTTETKILEENWNGYEYYVKAEIIADPEEVLRRINQTLSARRSSEVIDSLKILLSSSKHELELQSQELKKVKIQLESQNNEVKSKQEALTLLNQQLTEAKQQLSTYQAQEKQILSEIEAIEQKIKNATSKAVVNVRIGMLPSEVRQVCGNPRSTEGEDYSVTIFYNYGNVWVMFESNVVTSVFPSKFYKGPWTPYIDEYRERNIKY